MSDNIKRAPKDRLAQVKATSLDAAEFASTLRRIWVLEDRLAKKAIEVSRIWAQAYLDAEHAFVEENKDIYNTGLWWSEGVMGAVSVGDTRPLDLRNYSILKFYEFHLGRVELNEYRMLHSHWEGFDEELAVELIERNGRDVLSFTATIPQTSNPEFTIHVEILAALMDLSLEEQESFARRTMSVITAQANIAKARDVAKAEVNKEERRRRYERLKAEFEEYL